MGSWLGTYVLDPLFGSRWMGTASAVPVRYPYHSPIACALGAFCLCTPFSKLKLDRHRHQEENGVSAQATGAKEET